CERQGMFGQTAAFVVQELKVQRGLSMRDAGDFALHFHLLFIGKDVQPAAGANDHSGQALQMDPAESGLAPQVLPHATRSNLQRKGGDGRLRWRRERAEAKALPLTSGGLAADGRVVG